MGTLELRVTFLLEILGHCALYSLSTLQLQRKRLMAGRAAGNITHAVFPLRLSTVGHFHLQALDLGEAHTLRVREGFGLLIYVPDVEHLTHELNHWLCLVEGSG